MKQKFRLASAGLALVLGASVLAGCSGPANSPGGSNAGTTTVTGDPVSSGAGAGGAGGSTSAAQGPKDIIPGMGEGFAGISNDVRLTTCEREAGPAKASGTVRNGAAEARDVMVAVLWMSPANEAVSIKVFTQKEVAPGATVDFSVETELPEAATRCQLNAKANKVGSLP